MKFFKKIICLNFLFLFFCSFLFLFEMDVQANGNQFNKNKTIFLATVEDEIKAGTLQYLERVIRTAEQEKAEYVIIKLETPGGLLKATKDIVGLILETEITTIVFVHNEGGWAYSAGTFILMAADYAVVHPMASIGAAQPAIMGTEKAANEKMIEGMASWMRTLAETHQRNPEIAEKFVLKNLTLTGQEAKEKEVIDETARNIEELFYKFNILEARIEKIYPNFVEKFFNFLSHPYLVSLFLMIGGLAIIMAVRSGEFEATGIIGVIALLIGLWGMGIITFSFLGIGLLLVGFFLLIMELFIEPGFGVFGILGTIAMVLGIFTFGAEPFFVPEFFDIITMIVLGATLSICLFFVIITRALSKSFRLKPKTGPEALIGLQAEVIKELNPLGRVQILSSEEYIGGTSREETWLAEILDKGTILKGTRVEIVKVEGNTVFVKKVE